jgi:putative transposase
MPRLPRVVIVDVPHHVTQRGNARQVTLSTDADRITYLELGAGPPLICAVTTTTEAAAPFAVSERCALHEPTGRGVSPFVLL